MKVLSTKIFNSFMILIIVANIVALGVPIPSWLDENSLKTSEALKSTADLVVAKDGSGDFLTVNEAVAAAPENSQTRFVIYVKGGIYSEIVQIEHNKTNITIVGDGQDSTIITGNLNAKDGIKTFYSATLAVNGDDFMAQDICVQNTAVPAKGQAVALRVSGDRSIIHRCRIESYQDTLYAFVGRQFYRDSYITGTVDFIFGHAAAVFQYCQIVARKPIGGQSNMITAQNSDNEDQTSGFSIQRCNITTSPDLSAVKTKVKTYLGRPWGIMATVVVMESFIDDHIDPAGWFPWDNDRERLSSLYYAEYNNKGPGANTSQRVKWKGFRFIRNPKEAENFTVDQLIRGSLWINSTRVPYEKGL